VTKTEQRRPSCSIRRAVVSGRVIHNQERVLAQHLIQVVPIAGLLPGRDQ